jgi:signal transduction histidine kinase
MMLGSLLEVTLLSKALAERINEMLREKERVEAEMIRASGRALVGELAAGVAHEVNNPLAGVMLCFNGIISSQEGDPQRDELIASVKAGLAKIRATVAQLLHFSRMADTEVRPVDLRCLIDSTLALCRYQLDKGNIEVSVQIDNDMPLIPLDEMKMGQVLINLLLNAQHAMPDGGTLTIRAVRSGDLCELSVIDTGIGIPPDIMPKIFDPFFSSRPADEGTGLGLSICKNIVEAHGGTIHAESVTGQGTSFEIRIPLMS